MESKEYLTNKKFCPIPWTGFMYNSNGDVLNCIRSQRPIGNLKDNSIHDILKNNTVTKQNMLEHKDGQGCHVCYDLEGDKKGYDMISDRIFYLKELKSVDNTLYDQIDNFNLHKIDIRWSNVCNHACVYCGPDYSSKWATELKIKVAEPTPERVQELKKLVFDNAHQLKHVYLAGGEPLLMKENLELLEILQEKNPGVNIRVNTNLSKTGTRVFEKICEFKNVHWTVSLDTIEKQFEYIRYGGVWQDFLDNLKIITKLEHKISFNMLWYAMNYKSIFDTVDYLKGLGYHNNSFIIGPIINPQWQDVRHLPDNILDELKETLSSKIAEAPGFLLEDSYRNMLSWINEPFDKNLEQTLDRLKEIDTRRNLNSKNVFKELYEL
jgi:MoaA/NifB/PqqE/SkfB family radical SAM enzyme